MHDAAGRFATPGHRAFQGVHREASLHPVAGGVAEDRAAEHVLDRAEVRLALDGPALGDLGEPELVDVTGGEVGLDRVTVHRRARTLPGPGSLPTEQGPPLVVTADPPRGPLAHALAGGIRFASEESVLKLS